MNIDLNSNDYDASEGSAIFAGGNAGMVENVTITIEKKDIQIKTRQEKNSLQGFISNVGQRSGYW